ncbi:hypothetical protein NDU88_003965 [Pleurodeles waltl]|uniref:Uncharacterized protein n=1 Tax=Pleurodeles waltl TaxID=8319 RepID=A0AAV7LGY4_PLEWA|nr:hypothetical protein NDU88_003965 [Pleurodeles waltl]
MRRKTTSEEAGERRTTHGRNPATAKHREPCPRPEPLSGTTRGTWVVRRDGPEAGGHTNYPRGALTTKKQTPAGPVIEDWAARRSGQNQRDDRSDMGSAPPDPQITLETGQWGKTAQKNLTVTQRSGHIREPAAVKTEKEIEVEPQTASKKVGAQTERTLRWDGGTGVVPLPPSGNRRGRIASPPDPGLDLREEWISPLIPRAPN